MDTAEYDRIIELFRPEDLWRCYGLIDRFLNEIDEWLPIHTLNRDQLIRYMLVGFFPLWRAANHLGSDMQTIPESWHLDRTPHMPEQERAATFNRLYGRPIRDSLDYLDIITGNTHNEFDWFADGMFTYVIHGPTRSLTASAWHKPTNQGAPAMTNDWTAALGPLEALFADPWTTDIMADAPDRVLVARKGKLQDSGVAFASAEAMLDTINAVAALGGLALDRQRTTADMRLPDGSRMTAIVPPTAVHGPCLTISKLVNSRMTWDMLVDLGALTREAVGLLQHAVQNLVSTLVVGGAASGKTSVLNLLAGGIGDQERVIVVQDRHELQFDHPRAIFLEAGGAAGLAVDELLETATLMRPEWLVVNQLRGAEAWAYMNALSLGHSGLAALHATSDIDALQRLEAMCLMADSGLGLSEIRAMIAAAVGLIVVQRRMPDGQRKITQVVELRGVERDRFVLQPLLSLNAETGRLETTGVAPQWAADHA
ncbi:MAG TPA: ATPase, T2SS/T4P/T4SS family [Herpetosiphonaceae bacterium]|nr:ATPase, T2SS/T4P/T4SS family [Herpetosiphonaceae bacterium]